MVSPNSKPRRVLLAVLCATLAIFGALVAGITWELRGRLRTEVLRREAEAIHAVASLMQRRAAEERVAPFNGEDATEEAFAAVLESSRLRGVLAVRLFDTSGALRAALPFAKEGREPHWWDPALTAPQARFVAAGALEDVFGFPAEPEAGATQVPLLDVVVPLDGGNQEQDTVGVARYWIDGQPVAAEFARMDRRLIIQAAVAFAGGAALVGLVLAWAFARLAAVHRRLVEQSADLARANQELDFAAKTGALGAISAHLIHGLKNPLAGLEGFVVDAASGTPDAARGEACRTAMETTRRLRALVNEVTTVLRDEEDGSADYPVLVAEVVEAARIRALPAAEDAGIELNVSAERQVQVSARTANLAGLVLANLVANAIEASPRGSAVSLDARGIESGVEFTVRDTGAGLPASVQGALFRPVRSNKRGGGGVGLAISHRLARHTGGELSLLRSTPQGSTFRLVVPALVPA